MFFPKDEIFPLFSIKIQHFLSAEAAREPYGPAGMTLLTVPRARSGDSLRTRDGPDTSLP